MEIPLGMIFSRSLLEIQLLFELTSGISTCSFFNTPGNSLSSASHPLPPLKIGFFLEYSIDADQSFKIKAVINLKSKLRPSACRIVESVSSKFVNLEIFN